MKKLLVLMSSLFVSTSFVGTVLACESNPDNDDSIDPEIEVDNEDNEDNEDKDTDGDNQSNVVTLENIKKETSIIYEMENLETVNSNLTIIARKITGVEQLSAKYVADSKTDVEVKILIKEGFEFSGKTPTFIIVNAIYIGNKIYTEDIMATTNMIVNYPSINKVTEDLDYFGPKEVHLSAKVDPQNETNAIIFIETISGWKLFGSKTYTIVGALMPNSGAKYEPLKLFYKIIEETKIENPTYKSINDAMTKHTLAFMSKADQNNILNSGKEPTRADQIEKVATSADQVANRIIIIYRWSIWVSEKSFAWSDELFSYHTSAITINP